ncbi:MAG: hypothetical protein GY928_34010 [Colwellia sp.]|nr:hypothetical protein [Colwellia sp.]
MSNPTEDKLNQIHSIMTSVNQKMADTFVKQNTECWLCEQSFDGDPEFGITGTSNGFKWVCKSCVLKENDSGRYEENPLFRNVHK